MTHQDHLIEQHILQYEARLKHMDEMLHRVDKHVEQGEAHPETEQELEALKGERGRLVEHLEDMKSKEPKEWDQDLSHTGPIGIWDAVAKRIEKLIERLD